ncbi:type II secretion system protein [Sporolactobacillus sp. STCC-11]|uniref:type II secretion system protein n=1 Tax=Sporolactobacillus caesalpiniae TaxID=3230362 RepID=UPI00339400CE
MKKFRDDRGIFLTEAMVAISILTLLMLVAMPILMQTYRERQMLKQKNEALSLLRYHLLSWKTESPLLSEPATRTPFQIEWIERDDHSAYLSVAWEYGGRVHQLFGEARK